MQHPDGTVTQTRYLPFGGYRDGSGGNPMTDRGYTGHKHNDDLGLIYMNARFYVPGIARFASADTIVPDPMNPQSFNRYSYVYNNPLGFTDPSGHCATVGYNNQTHEPIYESECFSEWGALQNYFVGRGIETEMTPYLNHLLASPYETADTIWHTRMSYIAGDSECNNDCENYSLPGASYEYIPYEGSVYGPPPVENGFEWEFGFGPVKASISNDVEFGTEASSGACIVICYPYETEGGFNFSDGGADVNKHSTVLGLGGNVEVEGISVGARGGYRWYRETSTALQTDAVTRNKGAEWFFEINLIIFSFEATKQN